MKRASTSIIITSLTAAMIMALPLAGFAKDNGNGRGNGNGNEGSGKPAIHLNLRSDQGHTNVVIHNNGKVTGNASSAWFNNFFSNWRGWFNRHEPATTTPPVFNRNRGGDNDNDNDDSGGTGTTTNNQGNLPPVISSVTAPTVLSVGQTGTWTVNASDPQNGSLTYSVNWGDNAPQPLFARFFGRTAFTQTSTFTHSYSSSGTFTVTFTVKDSAGLTTTSTVTTQATASTTTTTGEPVISDLTATSTRPRQGTISWTTDEAAGSTVWYSTNSPVDPSTALSVGNGVLTTSHSITLVNLASSTTYYVLVQSKDSSGNVSTSTTSFTTTANPIVNHGPIITNAIALVGTSTVQVNWTTNVLADSELYFSTTSPVTIGTGSTQAITDATLATSHSLTASGLSSGTTYYFILQSKDSGNNVRTAPQFTITTGM